MSRRKPGTLLPIEEAILAAGLDARLAGEAEFHGFAIAKAIEAAGSRSRLTAHGTLYKALERLERAGLLESRWEEPTLAAEQGRPRRRLYRVTGAGEAALARAQRARTPGLSEGLAPA